MAAPVSSAGPGDPDFRREVARLRAAERRRSFPLGLHLGHPQGTRHGVEVPWPVPAEYDAGLRFDVLDALLEQWDEVAGGPVCVWLTRPGVPTVHDVDLEWLAAATRGCGAHEVELLTVRAVTHTGWLDVVTGEQRVWRRLRL